MAVLNLVRRPRELGRIRMGAKSANGKPTRLTTFRLTSADRTLLEAAARLYGGEVKPWEAQPGQFELYTSADELPCMVAPQEVSQWYELWSGGGCQRRCDGETCTVSGRNGTVETVPCPCDPENRECKLTTRLSVLLHELPGMGTWRLESHGYFAATELPASAELLISLARRGSYAPAALAIEERKIISGGQTKRFPVPVLRIREALATLMTGEVISAPALPEPTRSLPARVQEAAEANERSATYTAETVHRNAPASDEPRELEMRRPAPESSGDRRASQTAPAESGGCPSCHAPAGKPHTRSCALQQGA